MKSLSYINVIALGNVWEFHLQVKNILLSFTFTLEPHNSARIEALKRKLKSIDK